MDLPPDVLAAELTPGPAVITLASNDGDCGGVELGGGGGGIPSPTVNTHQL